MELSGLIHQPALIKILIFFLAWVGIWLPIAMVSAILLNWHPPQPLRPQQKIILLASLYLIAPLLLAGVADLEQRSVWEYGLIKISQMGGSISNGLSLGAFSLVLLYGVQWLLGAIAWKHAPTADAQKATASLQPITFRLILGVGILACWISATEELVFRGFLQSQLQQDYPIWAAAAIASAIFALSHLLWNLEDTVPQLPGLWLMGMVLTLARICNDGSLGLAMGLHAGWIWGIALTERIFLPSTTARLPHWIIGSMNQPLASISSWVMLLALAGVLMGIYLPH